MKITEKKLREIVREEIRNIVNESVRLGPVRRRLNEDETDKLSTIMRISQNKLNNIIKEEIRRVLNEGVWEVPNTEDQALELWKLFQEPIPLGKAEDLLRGLIGDDGLYDRFYAFRNKTETSPNKDMRPVIADHLESYLETPNEKWNIPWSETSIEVLNYIVDNFGSSAGKGYGGQKNGVQTNGHI